MEAWSSSFLRDTPAVRALLAYEQEHLQRALTRLGEGSVLWLRPVADAQRKYAEDYSRPIFFQALSEPDWLNGCVSCATSLLPFQDGALRAIVLQHTLEYVDEPEALLAECARVLRDDGQLYVLGLRPFSPARLRRSYRARSPKWRSAGGWMSILRALGFREFDGARLAFAWPSLDVSRASIWKTQLAHLLPSLHAVFLLSARKTDVRALTLRRVAPKALARPLSLSPNARSHRAHK